MVELNVQPPSSEEGRLVTGGSKFQLSNHMAALSGMVSPHPNGFVSINLQVWSEGPP